MNVLRGMLVMLMLVAALPANAALKVLATTPEWGALTNELGGDKVDVYAATSAFQDVHRVDAKPSLVARARNAELVVAAGAELEVGWLPILLRESGNARIQPGNPGYFEADANLRLLEVPSAVDRSMGDVHPQGNPHAHLDARNVAIVATALTAMVARRQGRIGSIRSCTCCIARSEFVLRAPAPSSPASSDPCQGQSLAHVRM